MQIAIDGPAGSGKSTIAKIIADKYGLIYLDTGAMYRSAAWLKFIHELDYPQLCNVLKSTEFTFSDNGRSLTLNYFFDREYSVDVTSRIRTPDITCVVSEVSANPEVRAILTEKQREIAVVSDVVMDGRDIGTVVLPDADIKVFLTASAEVRAKRRMAEWEEKGEFVKYAKVLEDIKERDRQDSTRAAAPMIKAADAVEIDTSELTIQEVAGMIGRMIEV